MGIRVRARVSVIVRFVSCARYVHHSVEKVVNYPLLSSRNMFYISLFRLTVGLRCPYSRIKCLLERALELTGL